MSEVVCKTLELLAESKDIFVSALKNIFNTRTMATLKISDLSVGDWVQVLLRKCDYDKPDSFKAKVLTVVNNSVGVGYDNSGIVMSAFVEDLQPIPITAEILEKNGFERSTSQFIVYHTDKVWISYDKPSETWSVTMYINDFTSNLHANILHIHQLQHALRLAGVEKEINL